MTEHEWRSAKSVEELENMIVFLEEKTSSRKLQLFACASCRRVWPLFKCALCREAVALVEQIADGGERRDRVVSLEKELENDYEVVSDRKPYVDNAVTRAALCALYAPQGAVDWWTWETVRSTAQAVDGSRLGEPTEKGDDEERRGQTELLRHIIGNPFRPYPAPPSWPSTVVQLAESLYDGQDCAFALHDALLEAGHAELAEHFRSEQWHPKGCWVVDLILGKT
jgi:hypothetical protein